jgi:hypothetical protein
MKQIMENHGTTSEDKIKSQNNFGNHGKSEHRSWRIMERFWETKEIIEQLWESWKIMEQIMENHGTTWDKTTIMEQLRETLKIMKQIMENHGTTSGDKIKS